MIKISLKKRYRLPAVLAASALILVLLVLIAAAPAKSAAALSEAVPLSADVPTFYAVPENGIVLPCSETLVVDEEYSLPADIPESGEYCILLTYKPASDILQKSTLTLRTPVDLCTTQIVSLWTQAGARKFDASGNELPQKSLAVDTAITDYAVDQGAVSALPFAFFFEKGAQTISFVSNDVDVDLLSVTLVGSAAVLGSEGRLPLMQDAAGEAFVVIEGESYTAKSDSAIRGSALMRADLSPHDYSASLINTLSADSFKNSGQKVLYSFQVQTAGVYRLSFHYSQDYKEGIPAYINVCFDGGEQYFWGVPFDYTGSEYENFTLTDPVALTAGEHTLLLEAGGAPLAGCIGEISGISKELSSLGLQIKKVSGSGASALRSWDVESYIPGILEKLSSCYDRLLAVYGALEQIGEPSPAAASKIKLAAGNLEKLLEAPDKIPANLRLLSEGTTSCTSYLMQQVDVLSYQSVGIDRIYLHGENYSLPAENAGALTDLAFGIKRLVSSRLSSKKDGGKDALTVWINRSIQYAELLQQMSETFTEQTGIKVDISLLSNEQRILLTNASGGAPDVVLGLAPNTPFDLGIRGAAVDLSEYAGFGALISGEYDAQAIVPYILEDKVYGLPETREFYVLMYREDILNDLGLTPPRTWDEVAEMMPALRRASMNFYLQLSGFSGTKPLYATAPFILQAGGELFSEDGHTTLINSPAALRGFETLTDLYRLYSVQPVVASFYNSFRYGEIPIGIASFSDYVKIKNAAPEISSLWKIAPAPGFLADDGSVVNGTTTASTACAILEASGKKDEAWEFLKWWLSAGTQAEFGNTLANIYGADYLWNTANNAAFEQLAFSREDKAVIRDQRANAIEINRHPALYAVERELSDAWSSVVLDGQSARLALDKAVLNINREFSRKLFEFGYADDNGRARRGLTYKKPEEILE
ncbi:MAG: extracellular solute-binding protein [Oscillospiraceae bacterium]|jgi:ABC-type glycerol-3-phosphate transport system substrate-binding protein|nr:extracellular solute-binding protein [Oscillospiraceae bacterium]